MLLEMLARSVSHGAKIRVLPDDPQATAFAEVWARAERAGRWLATRVEPGGTVVGVLSSSKDCLASVFGAWRAGLTFASLPYPGRTTSPEEYAEQIASLAKQAEAQLLLIDRSYAALLPTLPLPVEYFGDWRASSAALVDSGGSFVQFTSGTTSVPKGVRLELTSIADNVRSLLEMTGANPSDVVCSWLPISHDMGLFGLTVAAWCSGAEIVLIRPEWFRARPSIWLEACSRFGATITGSPNYGLELACGVAESTSNLELSSIRYLATGGEPVRPATLRRFQQLYRDAGFREIAFSPAYGMAEATLAISSVRPEQMWSASKVDREAILEGRWETGRGDLEVASTGAPLAATRIRIAAEESAAIGPIEVASPSLFSGYVGKEPRKGEWFRTGDVGVILDGELYVLGRTDDVLVFMGGQGYHAGDLEGIVATHPVVHRGNCCVLKANLDCVVVCETQHDLAAMESAAEWVRHALSEQCGLSETPISVYFVGKGSIAKTPSGKLQRPRIQAALEAGDVDVLLHRHFPVRRH